MGNIEKRGKVWLAVSGLVQSVDGRWLVVKKKYGGLKGQWSLPAGFVEKGETADEAVIREVKEETGITCAVKGLIGLRTGVIEKEISDNMIMFVLVPTNGEKVSHQEEELYEAKFIAPEKLLLEKDTSTLLRYLIHQHEASVKQGIEGLNPGEQFGYTSYKLFL
ncbi:NUDIX hydrolase [Neobacillus massiliamazoniensis]|uniref:NUDIX hydrolase n=1 Tax=Neobacillus massiliamazoniensis TaxID=1499688 RepID=A0A0U1NUA6_9BACI|nr:NUDIX hydrolase [Neobacillus massiliamazoniensis]